MSHSSHIVLYPARRNQAAPSTLQLEISQGGPVSHQIHCLLFTSPQESWCCTARLSLRPVPRTYYSHPLKPSPVLKACMSIHSVFRELEVFTNTHLETLVPAHCPSPKPLPCFRFCYGGILLPGTKSCPGFLMLHNSSPNQQLKQQAFVKLVLFAVKLLAKTGVI